MALRTWFSNLNNLLTTFGAIVASIAAIFSTLKSKIERIESQVKKRAGRLDIALAEKSHRFKNTRLGEHHHSS